MAEQEFLHTSLTALSSTNPSGRRYDIDAWRSDNILFNWWVIVLHIKGKISTRRFLDVFPSSWNQIALIMRNKPDIDEIDIDDLYNNLRGYEDELKSTASGDFRVSTTGGINQVPSTPCAHDVAYSFLAQPTTSPQLENEDF
ncbi:hypothetical protein Tco_0305189 [Tanacetum coccineum]